MDFLQQNKEKIKNYLWFMRLLQFPRKLLFLNELASKFHYKANIYQSMQYFDAWLKNWNFSQLSTGVSRSPLLLLYIKPFLFTPNQARNKNLRQKWVIFEGSSLRPGREDLLQSSNLKKIEIWKNQEFSLVLFKMP